MKTIIKTINYSKVSLHFYPDNIIMYQLDKQDINWFHSNVIVNNQTIDTRNIKRTNINKKIKDNKCYIDIEYKQDNISLIQHIIIEKDKNYFVIYLTLKSNKTVKSNYLVPLNFPYPKQSGKELFLSLEERMLVVPYDNDMWVHYECAPLAPGKTSYDLSAIYNPDNSNGLIIGALDFDVWKNAIKCSAYDARSFMAISGIADEYTHDHLTHGYMQGNTISSSRFICGYYNDIKKGLEEYSQLVKNNNGIYHWNNGVPFGWNSYSAFELDATIDNINSAASFLKQLKNFKTQDNKTYINFDAVHDINKKQLKELIDELHNQNQKVGWYMNPLSHLQELDNVKLLGSNLKRKDILLKNIDGTNYPKIDNKYPIDITIPEAELDFRLALREFVELGFDYLKIDFLSHGALEGKYHNKNIKTGRQALTYFYKIILEELDPKKINREIFISSSIDPLFPCGYSHSRRFACDSFGHNEDVKYILNALTFSYWTNNTLYQFNDPDHIVLYHSLVDVRNETNKLEAKARYQASIISGTVMLLSDNYGPNNNTLVKNAKQRAKQFGNNAKLNAIARLNKSFIPLYLKNDNDIFYLNDDNNYLAIFNTSNETKKYNINHKDINFPANKKLRNLYNNKSISYKKLISIELKANDSIIYQLI